MPTLDLMESHPIEQKMGMKYFCSKTEGFGGKLRINPKDFQVEEILPDGRIIPINDKEFSLGADEPGLFTEFILIKKNFESHMALLKIANAFNISSEDVNFAGTKDKTAYTAQRATIWRVKPEELSNLHIKGLEIRSPRTIIYRTFLGDLKGNYFTIKIRDPEIDKDEIKERIKAICNEHNEFNGISNFFGHQRFGSRRPISHIVGKLILLGKIKEAVEFYLTDIGEYESDATKESRRELAESDNYSEIIKTMPKNMTFEKLIVNHFIKRPNDYFGALQSLPRNLKRMFIHSYQSFIWNLMLSERMKEYGNLNELQFDIKEDNEIVQPIIGYETKFPDNQLYDFVKNLLEQDGIKPEHFKVKMIPNIKFPGSNRPISIKPIDFDYSIGKDSLEQTIIKLKFSLRSGSYATVLLREFLKTNPLNY
ncbi:MAG: tRNA pseudouridine(13) synthase TruD [Asgard group archaeon]|nr:tRNA pseudouridine(13) synthase TruD [Asgard group archaeon]